MQAESSLQQSLRMLDRAIAEKQFEDEAMNRALAQAPMRITGKYLVQVQGEGQITPLEGDTFAVVVMGGTNTDGAIRVLHPQKEAMRPIERYALCEALRKMARDLGSDA